MVPKIAAESDEESSVKPRMRALGETSSGNDFEPAEAINTSKPLPHQGRKTPAIVCFGS